MPRSLPLGVAPSQPITIMEPTRVPVLPPDPLPVNKPHIALRDTAMPEDQKLEGSKKPWLSKTLAGILVALFWLVADPLAAMFGADISFLRDGFQVPEDFIPVAALLVAFYGRLFATKKIG